GSCAGRDTAGAPGPKPGLVLFSLRFESPSPRGAAPFLADAPARPAAPPARGTAHPPRSPGRACPFSPGPRPPPAGPRARGGAPGGGDGRHGRQGRRFIGRDEASDGCAVVHHRSRPSGAPGARRRLVVA